MSVLTRLYYLYRTEVRVHFPWYKQKLLSQGQAFAQNYSLAGNAVLTVWPCEGDAGSTPVVGDRHYEYAYTVEAVIRHVLIGKAVLDIGSAGSFLPSMLAALGLNLTCLDVREWPMQWSGLRVVQGDLVSSYNTSMLAPESFDGITCISTLEHFGLGRYGDALDIDGDVNGMQHMRRFLKAGGLMILTIPYGRAEVDYPAHRIYDQTRFQRVIMGMEVVEQRFYGPVEIPWRYRPCTQQEAEQLPRQQGYAVICCVLRKK
ncbi:MAG: class I SAM-dependent methyltransferase [Aggregatilineales bacterium]